MEPRPLAEKLLPVVCACTVEVASTVTIMLDIMDYISYDCVQFYVGIQIYVCVHFSSHVMTIGGMTSMGAGRKNLVMAVSVTACGRVQ